MSDVQLPDAEWRAEFYRGIESGLTMRKDLADVVETAMSGDTAKINRLLDEGWRIIAVSNLVCLLGRWSTNE